MNEEQEKHICENPKCRKEHDGSYGSGRFCSEHCRRIWIGIHSIEKRKANGTFISGWKFSKKKRKIAPYGTWKCSHCSFIGKTRKELSIHHKKEHPQFCVEGGWNKGLTKETSAILAKAGNTLKEGYASGRLKGSWCGRKHTEEQKKAISESMKRAQAEGRAYSLGTYRRFGNPSRPERWMIEVIANEFEDKNYQREYRIFQYSLDFAWPEKKKYIEMDGKQHEILENKLRDIERDKKICAEGWEVLRMPWDKVCQNPKLWIQKAKDFIHSTNLSTI